MPNPKTLDVVIVGAGIGGTALAARLVSKGHRVTVFEKNTFCGGRCSLIEKDGFRFDQGPSMLLMPRVFEQTFKDLGEDITETLDIRKCPTNYMVHFPDNDSITLSTDLANLKQEIERIEPGSFEGLLGFLAESRYNHDKSFDMVLTKNYPHWWSLMTLENAYTAFKIKIHSTLWNRVGKYFKSDKLRKAFTFQSMYMGMSPFDAPGAYSLLAYSEISDGIYYPIGGFNKIATELERIAVSRGAIFRYSSEVKSIDIDEKLGLASGVTLVDGEKVKADVVICNQDLVTAYNQLLPASPYAEILTTKNQTCSTISFYWGLKRKLPDNQFHTHNLFIAFDYKESFDSIFGGKTLPKNPSLYIHVPSRVDPTCAPEGCEAIVVLVPTGVMTEDTTLEIVNALYERARKSAIEAIQSRIPGCADFEEWITSETVNTPYDWKEKFSLWQGSALGLSHNLTQVIYMRPSIRHAEFGNLFFVGASTHPGTGVPVVLCGAKIVEDEILKIHETVGLFRHVKFFGARLEDSVTAAVFVGLFSGIIGFVDILVFQYASNFQGSFKFGKGRAVEMAGAEDSLNQILQIVVLLGVIGCLNMLYNRNLAFGTASA